MVVLPKRFHSNFQWELEIFINLACAPTFPQLIGLNTFCDTTLDTFSALCCGHRVVWAVFNAALQDAAKQKGLLLHKRNDDSVLTKKDLKEFTERHADLVHNLTTFGSDIPTTSMHWHKQASNLEWMVRHMSWTPPWVAEPDPLRARVKRKLATATEFCSASTTQRSAQENEPLYTDPTPLCQLWTLAPSTQLHDVWGLQRIPAFWFTLNIPYNHLCEIHRFHEATSSCISTFLHAPAHEANATPKDPDAVPFPGLEHRCSWVLDHPDLVVQIHALRAELLVTHVMSHIVPTKDTEPFLYWLRFEFGKNGNPHVHGQCYVAGNPHFETVLKDEDARLALKTAGRSDVDFLPTWAEAETSLANFFSSYISEEHPCKDLTGNRRFDFIADLLDDPALAQPHATPLAGHLELALTTPRPDLTSLKFLVVALLESGQRHTAHGHSPPLLGVHACARESKLAKTAFCRYLFPREMWSRHDNRAGRIEQDPHWPDLRNLFLQRNDPLLNNYDPHLLLANLGNIDWRALINLWSVLEYLDQIHC